MTTKTRRRWVVESVGLLALATAALTAWSAEPPAPAALPAVEKAGAEAASPADIRKEAKQRYLAAGAQDAEAGKRFQKAADAGDTLAIMWLARLHKRGFAGLSKDDALAANLAAKVIAEIRKLAEAGDAEAQFLLGMAYSEPIGIPKDDKQAFTWLLAAAKQGEAMAMNNAASMLLDGIGTPRDEAAAFQWVTQSAEKGNAFAVGNLASYHHWGLGVEPDLQKAREWYLKARRTGRNVSDDLRLLTPCWSEHPFKADDIRATPYVKLFGLTPAELEKSAKDSGLLPATAELQKSEVGDMSGYECYAEGIRFGMRFGRLRSVELYADGAKGHARFKGTLPLGLSWEDTADLAQKKLGPPDDQGTVAVDTAYGMAYTIENLTLAVMFSYDDPRHIKLVRIYEKWPVNAKGVPTRDGPQPPNPAIRSHAD